MNIINTLTLRHLKLNKKRTIVTIIGIILSAAMITAVATFVTSFVGMMQRSAIEDTGNWHVLYKNVPAKNIQKVITDRNTKAAAMSKDIGYALLEGSKNEDKPYLFIKAFDEQSFETYNIDLIEGRLPKNAHEIVISSHIAENGGVKYKVGDTLKLDVGQRHQKEGEDDLLLGQENSFVEQTQDHSGERFVTEYSKEYTVTGIINRPNIEPYWSPGYTVVSWLDLNELTAEDSVNIAATWEKVNKKTNEAANVLAGNIGISGDSVRYNTELLRYHGIVGDNFLSTLYSLAIVVIILIITGSVALIYNSFAISISERSRHLGMLASVGATKSQKSRSVFYEGFVVGTIGIPLGVAFGTLGMGITFFLVQPLIEDAVRSGITLTLITSPTAILGAALLSIVTIFISAYIPARRAAKISPVDAIRQSQDIRLKARTVKTSRLTRFLFGFEAELALKNLKRNSRRYKATVFSLVISLVLFLSVSSLSYLTRRSTDIMGSDIPYDVRVYVNSSATQQEKKDFYSAIAKMDNVDDFVIKQLMDASVTLDNSYMPAELKELYQANIEEQSVKTYETFFQIISVDEKSLERYAREAGADAARLKDIQNPGGILINAVRIKNKENKYARVDQFDIKEGEKLKFDLIANGTQDFVSELEIVALADKTPIGESTLASPFQGMFIVSEEVFAQIQAKLPEGFDHVYNDMFIDSSDSEKLEESILEYQKQTSIASISIYNAEMERSQADRLYTFINVFLYGFVTLITAICAANIFNTISTSISLRKREFAMLKSVGMTPGSFNHMINYESLFYGIKALLYGLPISFGVMFLIYRSLRNAFDVGFEVPWVSVFTAIASVFVIVGSTMLYASSKIKKENIIDALKNENI